MAYKNGTVVKQIPSAGGVAMLGSSITITVYKVKGEPINEPTDGYGGSGYGGYGSGGSGYGTDDSRGSYGGSGAEDSSSASEGSYDDSSYGSGGEVTPEDGSSGPDWGLPVPDSDSGRYLDP